jgi:hypothetical protein
MGVRKSVGKNKKSKRAVGAAAVRRAETLRRTATRRKGERGA